MAKLRHLALSVKDLEESAKFYESAFGMERVRQSKVAIMLSDGVVSLALLHLRSNDNAPDERGPDYVGLHHMGFLVDDVPASSEAVEAAGRHLSWPDSQCWRRPGIGTQIPRPERCGDRRHIEGACGFIVARPDRHLISPARYTPPDL